MQTPFSPFLSKCPFAVFICGNNMFIQQKNHMKRREKEMKKETGRIPSLQCLANAPQATGHWHNNVAYHCPKMMETMEVTSVTVMTPSS